MHQLWQHPNGVYYVLYGPRLKRRISTRARNRGQAETFLAQFIAGSGSPLVDSPTVGEILAGYEADAKARVRSPDSLRYAVLALTCRLGSLRPTQLLPATIKGYARERKAAPGTVLREIGVLRAALGWAAESQWIAAVPVISSPVKAPKPRDRWLTREEARALLAACQEPHLRAFTALALFTAARSGAILELVWEQVDFDAGLIDYGDGHGNKRRSVVPINDELRKTLLISKELACTAHVIERHGKRVTAIKKGFRAACQRASLKGVSPHILRHTAATWMAMAGVSMREIARLLGDEEATVERVYAKHSPGYLAKATRALQLVSTDAENALQVKGGSPECGENVR